MTEITKEKLRVLEEKVNEYFSLCDAANAGAKKTVKPYTLSGLMSYTGLSRSELKKLSQSRKFKRLICDALSKIESFIEEKSLTGELSCNASMNSLKFNFGWGEKECDDDKNTQMRNIIVTLSGSAEELSQ